MAYDAARSEVVVFGGCCDILDRLGDTWVWDGSHWTQRHPTQSPPELEAASMAYDAARQKIVLFGGVTTAGDLSSETWTWDGVTWSRENPQTSPAAAFFVGMAYDAAREEVVLFNDWDETPTTWTWDGSDWTAHHPETSPPRRGAPAMAYDAARQEVILFGGTGPYCEPIGPEPNNIICRNKPNVASNDTWAWNGTTWTLKDGGTPASPAGRLQHSMFYDSTLQKIVLFGGRCRGCETTWTWDGARWLPAVTTSPPVTLGLAMAYDDARDQGVLFGGLSGCCYRDDDTWLWDGSSWSEAARTWPSLRRQASMAYDEANREVVLFGGYGGDDKGDFGDTWTWDGDAWKQYAGPGPSARFASTMAYDAARDEIILFGGVGYSYPERALGDTWAWDGTSWRQLSPATSPPARWGAQLAYDAAREEVTLFGGRQSSYDELGDTWTWDGTTWTLRSTSASPSPRSDAVMAYDGARDEVVLFGGTTYRPWVKFNDTWTWDGSAWTELDPARAPSPRFGAVMSFSQERQELILFGGQAQARFPNGQNADYDTSEMWSWDGSRWTKELPDTYDWSKGPPKNREDWEEIARPSGNGHPARVTYAASAEGPGGGIVMFGGTPGSSELARCCRPGAPRPDPSDPPATDPPVCAPLFVSPDDDAPNQAPGGDGANLDSLDIVSGSLDSRPTDGPIGSGGLVATIRVKDLQLTMPANAMYSSWYLQWSYQGGDFWAGATLEKGATQPYYSVGTFKPGTYKTTASTTGSFTTGPNGSIEINVPSDSIGVPRRGAILRKTHATTWVGIGAAGSGVNSPIDRGPKDDSTYGADYTLGEPCVIGPPKRPRATTTIRTSDGRVDRSQRLTLSGRVSAPASCQDQAAVSIYRQRRGERYYRFVGTSGTNSYGRWHLDLSARVNASYVARVEPTSACDGSFSDPVKVLARVLVHKAKRPSSCNGPHWIRGYVLPAYPGTKVYLRNRANRVLDRDALDHRSRWHLKVPGCNGRYRVVWPRQSKRNIAGRTYFRY